MRSVAIGGGHPMAIMSDQPITGAVAVEPGRGAAASLAQVLALPDFASDNVVIVGELDDYRRRRVTYREIFATLARARRSVLWMPGIVDTALERDVRGAYEMATPSSQPSTASVLLLTPGVPSTGLGTAANEILTELIQTFKPRLAARPVRPAVYVVRDHGRPHWVEV